MWRIFGWFCQHFFFAYCECVCVCLFGALSGSRSSHSTPVLHKYVVWLLHLLYAPYSSRCHNCCCPGHAENWIICPSLHYNSFLAVCRRLRIASDEENESAVCLHWTSARKHATANSLQNNRFGWIITICSINKFNWLWTNQVNGRNVRVSRCGSHSTAAHIHTRLRALCSKSHNDSPTAQLDYPELLEFFYAKMMIK